MKIIVLFKEVPDSSTERALDLETGLLQRPESAGVVDEICERALELALTVAGDLADAEVTVLMMARPEAANSLRKGLAMGADTAVHIVDDALLGADLGLTARVLAAALAQMEFDLVIAGNQSTDGAGGMLPAMIAELLGLPMLGELQQANVSESTVSGSYSDDDAVVRISAELPAVISITEQLPDPRFPTFKGIMAAKKKPVSELSLGALGVDAGNLALPHTIMTAVASQPPRTAGTKIVDEGDAGVKLAAFLREHRLV